jgi:hypothetical protein
VDLARLRRRLVTWLFGSRWAGTRRSRWLLVGLWPELLLGVIPLVGADFFRGCLVVLRVVAVATGCERRRFVSALLYRFAWVAARWCGFLPGSLCCCGGVAALG